MATCIPDTDKTWLTPALRQASSSARVRPRLSPNANAKAKPLGPFSSCSMLRAMAKRTRESKVGRSKAFVCTLRAKRSPATPCRSKTAAKSSSPGLSGGRGCRTSPVTARICRSPQNSSAYICSTWPLALILTLPRKLPLSKRMGVSSVITSAVKCAWSPIDTGGKK